MQLSLLEPTAPEVHADLGDYALLYTASFVGGQRNAIRFAMTVDDAMAWCDSPISQGQLYGTPWAYFWTRLSVWCREMGSTIDIRRLTDDGSWDERIKSLGLVKIPLSDFHRLFTPLGVTVLV